MTARKSKSAEKLQEQPQTQGMELTPQQVQIAAQAGVKLFSTEGAVQVPSTWMMNGTFTILNGLLNALAQGAAILANPHMIQELQAKADEAGKKPQPKKVAGKKTAKTSAKK